jgi:hypothetical protein
MVLPDFSASIVTVPLTSKLPSITAPGSAQADPVQYRVAGFTPAVGGLASNSVTRSVRTR